MGRPLEVKHGPARKELGHKEFGPSSEATRVGHGSPERSRAQRTASQLIAALRGVQAHIRAVGAIYHRPGAARNPQTLAPVHQHRQKGPRRGTASECVALDSGGTASDGVPHRSRRQAVGVPGGWPGPPAGLPEARSDSVAPPVHQGSIQCEIQYRMMVVKALKNPRTFCGARGGTWFGPTCCRAPRHHPFLNCSGARCLRPRPRASRDRLTNQ